MNGCDWPSCGCSPFCTKVQAPAFDPTPSEIGIDGWVEIIKQRWAGHVEEDVFDTSATEVPRHPRTRPAGTRPRRRSDGPTLIEQMEADPFHGPLLEEARRDLRVGVEDARG